LVSRAENAGLELAATPVVVPVVVTPVVVVPVVAVVVAEAPGWNTRLQKPRRGAGVVPAEAPDRRAIPAAYSAGDTRPSPFVSNVANTSGFVVGVVVVTEPFTPVVVGATALVVVVAALVVTMLLGGGGVTAEDPVTVEDGVPGVDAVAVVLAGAGVAPTDCSAEVIG